MSGAYSYYLEEDNGEFYYNFSTPEAEYAVYFNPNEYKNRVKEYPSLLANAYGFGFFQFPFPGIKVPKIDSKIKRTIEAIICDFYKDKPEGVLLYHCDYTDGRQDKRSKKFERWYHDSSARAQIKKHEITIVLQNEHVTHYIGYLYSHENKNIESVQNEFESFAAELANDTK